MQKSGGSSGRRDDLLCHSPRQEIGDAIERMLGDARDDEANAMHRLVLEAVEPALGRRVVPAVPFPAHRADPAVRLELVLKGMAGVWATPVGRVHQA